jgi:hypothetical protein
MIPVQARLGKTIGNKEKLVLPDRIELSASPLPRGCSTTELRQHRLAIARCNRIRRSSATRLFSTQGQKAPKEVPNAFCPKFFFMSKSEQAQLREQRLAAKLRENLKRRKAQTRARLDSDSGAPEDADGQEPAPGKP